MATRPTSVSVSVARRKASSEAPARPTRRPGPVLRQTSWSPGRDLEINEWVRQGSRLGALGRACNWWLGDWVRYGNARYGERYETATRTTGYEIQSLMNMAYVASRFEPSRRRETLSWSHHAELAALDPEEQELWLDRAEAEKLSVLALRIERKLPEPRPRPAAAATRARLRAVSPDHELVCPNCGHGFPPPEPAEDGGT